MLPHYTLAIARTQHTTSQRFTNAPPQLEEHNGYPFHVNNNVVFVKTSVNKQVRISVTSRLMIRFVQSVNAAVMPLEQLIEVMRRDYACRQVSQLAYEYSVTRLPRISMDDFGASLERL
jgi:hypothetical protein